MGEQLEPILSGGGEEPSYKEELEWYKAQIL